MISSASLLRGATLPRLLVVIVLSLSTLGCGDIFGAAPSGPEGPGTGGLEDAVSRLVNNHREQLGCPRLVWSGSLADVALRHSYDMLERDYFGHDDPDGRGLRERLEAGHIRYLDAAENIAKGFRYDDPAQRVFEGWLASPGHRRIIENCAFVEHGLGVADFRWTHVFLR